jgi:hypothetical protein
MHLESHSWWTITDRVPNASDLEGFKNLQGPIFGNKSHSTRPIEEFDGPLQFMAC